MSFNLKRLKLSFEILNKSICEFPFVVQFVSLYTTEAALEWEILRDCYEAFALYSFGRYLVACLGKASHNFVPFMLRCSSVISGLVTAFPV